ncbi:MAG: transposase [Enterococcus raffinosus]|nr:MULTISPECIES: transposase [Enterococcus]MDU6577472.1 transposase [Enterococcus raffinosus]UXK06727.1 transposase [Enterococcus raffinosus]
MGHLLSISDKLRIAHFFYQENLQAFHDKEVDTFFKLVRRMDVRFRSKRTATYKKAFIKYKFSISLTLDLPYSNAKIENLYTHIK